MAIPLSRDTFIWGMATLCNLHRIPFDAELLIRRFPPAYDLSVLQSAVKSFGFKVSLQASQLQALHPAVFPILVLLNPIPTNEASDGQSEAGNIELNGISFRYSDNHPWLYRNLSITIKPNKCTVLMGPSGCGGIVGEGSSWSKSRGRGN